ncbi:hypothetical protein ABIE27_001134 [Paenibacillus sp. 4624]|jgi:hypothetical protein
MQMVSEALEILTGMNTRLYTDIKRNVRNR